VADDVHCGQHQEYPAYPFPNVERALLDAPFFVRGLVLVGAEQYDSNHSDRKKIDDEVLSSHFC